MNKEEYLEKLKNRLENEKINNQEEILNKYENRFDIGYKAGLSDDEIIEMLGPVEEIILNNNVDDKTEYNLDITEVFIEDVYIKNKKGTGIDINLSDELKDYINITTDNHKIIIKNKSGVFFKKHVGSIEILIGENIKFNEVVINTVKCDYEIEQLDAQSISIATVSGDSNIERMSAKKISLSIVSADVAVRDLKANELIVSTVSGDITCNYVDVEMAKLSTISGDINLTGKIKEKRTSSISGDINIKIIE